LIRLNDEETNTELVCSGDLAKLISSIACSWMRGFFFDKKLSCFLQSCS